jgi:CheY-like chemotaxis protein
VDQTIAVIDDEKYFTIVLKKELKKYGLKVDAYIDPIQALMDYKPGSYDLGLFDLKMPGLDGC